ncbi:uncharacterized protein LOC126673591 [Mercurialis annua]|uniref:uncharacterized protein LOC126673591 n=1 Tax=Mercurialis annua TaxID=3986 RepID=UPI00215F206A|nr:uncharacterized protein LOC126673591 [Mercurialis annua]
MISSLKSQLQAQSHNSYGPQPMPEFFFPTTTEEPKTNTSTIIGNAQGFIIPFKHFARFAFHVIYLTFDTQRYSGSLLSVHAKHISRSDREELIVIGGIESFAFARGIAAFA